MERRINIMKEQLLMAEKIVQKINNIDLPIISLFKEIKNISTTISLETKEKFVAEIAEESVLLLVQLKIIKELEMKVDEDAARGQEDKQEIHRLREYHRLCCYKRDNSGGFTRKKELFTRLISVPASTTPLECLEITNLRRLLVNIPAKGFYLLLRTIEPAKQLHYIQTIVEDHNGNAITLKLYNFYDPQLSVNFEDILPVGTVLALKEPLVLKTNGFLVLKCDCPSDIMVIYRNHQLYETICKVQWQNILFENISSNPELNSSGEVWKARGNELFRQRKFTSALEAYLVAQKFNKNPKTLSLIHLNLAATYLALGYFETCLEYALKVLAIDPVNMKALYRAGKASYELRLFKQSKDYFEQVLAVDKGNLEAANELIRCDERIKEAAGQIDIPQLCMKALHAPKTKIDCADFVGPLKIVCIEGKGRGVIAEKNIKAGTLLIVSKALEVVFSDENGDIDEVDFGDNPLLKAQITQTVLKNPSIIGNIVYDLTSNDSEIDAKGKTSVEEMTKKVPVTDVERIRMIMSTNCFPIGFMSKEYWARRKEDEGTCLFNFPSYFNHSCLPNAGWHFYNDVIVMHALQSIRRGEEVTICYPFCVAEFPYRVVLCNKRNFQCRCDLCILDRELPTSVVDQVTSLMTEFEARAPKFLKSQKLKNLNKFKNIIDALEELFTSVGRNRLNLSLFRVYNLFSTYSMVNGLFSDSKLALENALRSIGLNSRDLLKTSKRRESDIFPKGSGTLCWEMLKMVRLGHIIYQGREQKDWIMLLDTYERVCNGGNFDMAISKSLFHKS